MLGIYLKYTKYVKYIRYKFIRYLKNIILLKNSWKIDTPFGKLAREVKKLARLGTLALQVEKLARLCHVGTFIGT